MKKFKLLLCVVLALIMGVFCLTACETEDVSSNSATPSESQSEAVESGSLSVEEESQESSVAGVYKSLACSKGGEELPAGCSVIELKKDGTFTWSNAFFEGVGLTGTWKKDGNFLTISFMDDGDVDTKMGEMEENSIKFTLGGDSNPQIFTFQK